MPRGRMLEEGARTHTEGAHTRTEVARMRTEGAHTRTEGARTGTKKHLKTLNGHNSLKKCPNQAYEMFFDI